MTNQPPVRPPAPLGATAHILIPGHPLVLVPDCDVEYYRCVGQFEFAPSQSVGTGTVIAAGPNIGILTCAHNLCLPRTNTLVDSIVFTPCRDPDNSPYSSIVVQRAQMWISPGYMGQTGQYDYAVVKLRTADLPADWMLGPLPQMQTFVPVDGVEIQVTGYPAETNDDHRMRYSLGNFVPAAVANGLVSYNASTEPGSSGSPVTVRDNLQDIFAVHIFGDRDTVLNYGVYLTPDIIAEITDEMGR